jgi:hypothetical protein
MAFFQLLLSAGDIELNPGPDSDSSSQQKNKQQRTSRSFSTICTECQKTVRKNQKDLYVMYANVFTQVVSESPIRTT